MRKEGLGNLKPSGHIEFKRGRKKRSLIKANWMAEQGERKIMINIAKS